MKILTILGTRPEIIRLSRVIPGLDNHCNHLILHTGQNFDNKLNEIFFKELNVRKPDFFLNCKSDSLMEQVGKILIGCEEIILKVKPDRVLILGDTNSALSAIVAKRMNIQVYHMEAGNRCYDDIVPEEVNRRIIDHSSDVLMPYTERSRYNLLREGISTNKVFVIGNPIKEVLDYYFRKIENSNIINKINLRKKKYFLVTLHRAENVDIENRLDSFIKSFNLLYKEFKIPIVISVHPRTRSQLVKQKKLIKGNGVLVFEPFGLIDFINLEKNALCVLTDSGTVQEECCIFKVPNVTLRDVTERPETIEAGSNIISGPDPKSILRCVNIVLNNPANWEPPSEYLVKNVSQTVIKIVLGYMGN